MLKVGFIGLGTMGFPIAGHISESYKTSVFNRTIRKSQKWTSQFKGEICESIQNLTHKSDVILLCLSEDKDIEEIVLGDEGVLKHLKQGTIVIDHSTTSVDTATAISNHLSKKDSFYLDAPVSGGEAGAQNGTLSVMIGGNKGAYKEISTLLDCYSSFHKYMGPSGNGQLTKMINQICITGVIKSLSEAINFAKAQEGLDLNKVFNAISSGAAQSWQLDNRFHTMVKGEFDFGFGIDLMIKDLKIAINQAKSNDVSLETVQSILDEYIVLSKIGGGDQDTSSLIKSLQNS